MATIRSTPPTGFLSTSRTRPSSVGTERRARRKSASTAIEAAVVQERVFPVFVILALLHLALAVRLAYLQVWRHGDLTKQAEQLRSRELPLHARRGELLDRNGLLLVQNQPAFDITLDPNPWYVNLRQGETPESREKLAIDSLQRILPTIDVAGIVNHHGIIKGTKGRYRSIEIAHSVNIGVGERIRAEKLLGVGVNPTTKRTAVSGTLAPHLIGFTGTTGQGLGGLEHVLERGDSFTLTGSDGSINAEFDSKGRVIPGTIKNHRPAQNGTNFLLTIDSNLQNTVQEALGRSFTDHKAEWATAVVLEPKTGEILAMASYPSYDVNHWKDATAEARSNKAVVVNYEPGSIMKTFTIAGALEDHKITPQNSYFCMSNLKVGRKSIHCHQFIKHGQQNVTQVLANSCNVATAEIGFSLGKLRLDYYLRAFGFGHKTKSGIPGEGPGRLVSPDKWPDIQFANIAFGQGIAATALQLAAGYGAIANDGVYMRPHILRGTQDELGQINLLPKEEGRRVVSTETARTMQQMLYAAVEDGTGKPARLDGYTAGGKTATAQLSKDGQRGYSDKYVSSFAGMAPAKNPQFVILVTVAKPKGGYYGSTVAGPVFKEIAEKALLARRTPHDGVLRKKPVPVKSDTVD